MKLSEVQSNLIQLHESSRLLRTLSEASKNQVLVHLELSLARHTDEILASNEKDVEDYKGSPNFKVALMDRLILSEKRLHQMRQSLLEVVELPDPVGMVHQQRELTNGLLLQQVQSPLGVIFMIFEARPNVVTEAFSLGFKSGNGLILKGGKESQRTCKILYRLIHESLQGEGIPVSCLWGLSDVSRDITDFLIKQNRWIDVLIPRGGEPLIAYVTQNATIPIIKNDRGLCHVYVHEEADLAMALQILVNGKVQRPSVCNSVETVLVDQRVASSFLLSMHEILSAKGVQFFACPGSHAILSGRSGVHLATATSFDTEYLDLILNVRMVEGLEEALDHIENHGSRHSEAIITKNSFVAKKFQQQVDAAAVYWNASTRFTDGGQFGLGAEIGISTQKLHVRGPVGLHSLTSLRWLVDGVGQIRPD